MTTKSTTTKSGTTKRTLSVAEILPDDRKRTGEKADNKRRAPIEPQKPSRWQQVANCVLLGTAPLPAVVACVGSANGSFGPELQTVYLDQPVTALNYLFFILMVYFWILSLVQKSTWLIDPYWTLLPLLVQVFYATHPAAIATARAAVITSLLWLWGLRLTWNYFRREEWCVGWREDWRFADYRRKLGRGWPLASLFIAYLSQQAMLVGLTLPLHAVYTSPTALNTFDLAAVFLALAGLAVAKRADDELDTYMRTADRPVVLDKGLWGLSRH